jgi:hypothetical protein
MPAVVIDASIGRVFLVLMGFRRGWISKPDRKTTRPPLPATVLIGVELMDGRP